MTIKYTLPKKLLKTCAEYTSSPSKGMNFEVLVEIANIDT